MLVPETTVDEYRDASSTKYDIWLPRKLFGMQTVTQPTCVQGPADDQFELGVAPFNKAHLGAALGIHPAGLRYHLLAPATYGRKFGGAESVPENEAQ